ncbi:NAD(P)-binding protein, partial [Wolfiporia cocos MD-104 SS10]
MNYQSPPLTSLTSGESTIMPPRIWFITGASSGFGRSMTESVLRHGDIVVATLRKPEVLAQLSAQYPPQRLLVLQLDVSKSDQIVEAFRSAKEAFRSAKEAFGRIDVVFNNAGFYIVSEIEGTPDDIARTIFEVNFWGAVNVSREAIRFFREVNIPPGGRLLQNSSMFGYAATPILGYYSATKKALEGVTEALAGELDPEWGVKITLVELGGFRTNVTNAAIHIPQHPAYSSPRSLSTTLRELYRNHVLLGDVDKATEAIYGVSLLQELPFRLPLGKDAISHIKAQSARILA